MMMMMMMCCSLRLFLPEVILFVNVRVRAITVTLYIYIYKITNTAVTTQFVHYPTKYTIYD